MNTDKVVKESKTIMMVTLVIGAALLATGIIFKLLEINFLPKNGATAIVALSLTPFGTAFAYYVKLSRIKKSPQKFIINEIDERLVALKNEADAKAFKIVQGALFLTYMGYTLMIPKDVFESVGWWILMILLLTSFISQAILTRNVMVEENSKTNEEE